MSLKDVFDKLRGKGSKAEPEVNEEDKPKVINGYLQTSNTRVIRPMYSNTREGREERRS